MSIKQNTMERACAVCGAAAAALCSRCKRVRYCSAKCQKAGWKQHKLLCGATDGPAAAGDAGPGADFSGGGCAHGGGDGSDSERIAAAVAQLRSPRAEERFSAVLTLSGYTDDSPMRNRVLVALRDADAMDVLIALFGSTTNEDIVLRAGTILFYLFDPNKETSERIGNVLMYALQRFKDGCPCTVDVALFSINIRFANETQRTACAFEVRRLNVAMVLSQAVRDRSANEHLIVHAISALGYVLRMCPEAVSVLCSSNFFKDIVRFLRLRNTFAETVLLTCECVTFVHQVYAVPAAVGELVREGVVPQLEQLLTPSGTSEDCVEIVERTVRALAVLNRTDKSFLPEIFRERMVIKCIRLIETDTPGLQLAGLRCLLLVSDSDATVRRIAAAELVQVVAHALACPDNKVSTFLDLPHEVQRVPAMVLWTQRAFLAYSVKVGCRDVVSIVAGPAPVEMLVATLANESQSYETRTEALATVNVLATMESEPDSKTVKQLVAANTVPLLVRLLQCSTWLSRSTPGWKATGFEMCLGALEGIFMSAPDAIESYLATGIGPTLVRYLSETHGDSEKIIVLRLLEKVINADTSGTVSAYLISAGKPALCALIMESNNYSPMVRYLTAVLLRTYMKRMPT